MEVRTTDLADTFFTLTQIATSLRLCYIGHNGSTSVVLDQ